MFLNVKILKSVFFSLPLRVLVIMKLLGPVNCQLPLSSEAEMNLFSKARKLNLLLWLWSLHHLLPLSLPEINVLEIKNKQATVEIFSPIWK